MHSLNLLMGFIKGYQNGRDLKTSTLGLFRSPKREATASTKEREEPVRGEMC